MIQFISRMPRRLVAIPIALMAILSFTVLTGGVAYASAQANQMWFGPYWSYLGWTSGETYYGHIHTFQASDKCLDVPGYRFYYLDSNNNPQETDPSGAQVQLWDCQPNTIGYDYDKNQLWQQQDHFDGSWSYYVSNAKGFFCLDSLLGHHFNGSPVEVYQCNGDNAQRWTIGPNGQLQSVDSPGYCLDDANWGTDNGSKMQLWQCAY